MLSFYGQGTRYYHAWKGPVSEKVEIYNFIFVYIPAMIANRIYADHSESGYRSARKLGSLT